MTAHSDRFSIQPRSELRKPPPRLVVFGEPGVGKSTFGCSAPYCILIACEDGALGADVVRLPNTGKCETWDDVLRALATVQSSQHNFEWVVIDTINAAEQLCTDMVVRRDFGGHYNSAKGIEGYNAWGRGDKAVAQEFRALLAACDRLQQQRNCGIILLAHVGLHRSSNALGADFVKFGGDLNKHTWAMTCAWADQVAFACRELRASTREGETRAKAQAIGQERWLVFEGGPGLDAKSRIGYEMPPRILLSWDEYAKHRVTDRIDDLVTQAIELMAQVPNEVRAKVESKAGGPVTADVLRGKGKAKLEQFVGWLLAQQPRG